MQVHVLPALMDNYVYLLDSGGGAVVIDPADAQVVSNGLAEHGMTLKLILNTHHHHDHVGGNSRLRRTLGCPVYGPDDKRIPDLDQGLHEGDVIDEAGGLRVLETPGHGSADLSFYLPATEGREDGLLFCGDTLFIGGCGRLFDCGPEVMWASLCKLAVLPGPTRVYCGHNYTLENYAFALSIDPSNDDVLERVKETKERERNGLPMVPSTIGIEKRTNPFLRSGSDGMKELLGMQQSTDAEVFAELRRRKDDF